MKRIAFLGLVGLAFLAHAERYWMRSPAATWDQALPLGNGRLAALVFGQPNIETIVLNESSVWSPPRGPHPVNPAGAQIIPQIRALLFADRHHAAEKLCNDQFLCGDSSVLAAYQPLVFVNLSYSDAATPFTDYSRALTLSNGISRVAYTQRGVSYSREAFVAYDDDVFNYTVTASRKGALSFTLSVARTNATVTVVPPNRLRLSGSTGEGGVAFELLMEVATQGGSLTPVGSTFIVKGADSATLRATAFTQYNFRNPREPLARDCLACCEACLDKARRKGAEQLKKDHARAFSALYGRAFVHLGGADSSAAPALEDLFARAREAKAFDPYFLTLYADFCRYALISSSRPGGLPSNLQGIWNPLMDPPWRSDWHLDINLSMNYWSAAAWDLAPLAEPLVSLAEMGFAAARPVAREMLGVREGSFMTTSTDAWGFSTPFRKPCWGMYVSGGAWLLQDALLPWRATHDEAILRRLLPLLREQTLFYLGWLMPDPRTGRLVSGPCASPENTYCGADGDAAIDMGPTHDQELCFATFTDFIRTARRLTPDDPLIACAQAALEKLALPRIAPDGSLMEWSHDFAEKEPSHRHLSHLWGMMPGRRISLAGTPAEAEAVRRSIEKRIAAGHHLMGWSIGHRACLSARLGDGEAALAACDAAPRYLRLNLFTSAVGATRVADMYGVPAALNEMLLRSYTGTIEILPALPGRFRDSGRFRLLAEGGFLVEAEWKDARVRALTITSRLGGPCTIRVNGQTHALDTRKGEVVRVL